MAVMRPSSLALPVALLIAGLSACSKPSPQPSSAEASAERDPIGADPTSPGASIDTNGTAALAAPSVAQNTDDPASFVPLQSQPVKDAIYRALKTGRTQRWQDGKLSGYAVPSATTAANGCRAVRYTVDQRPEVPFESINACAISR
jgi:hypothetical protein